MSSISPEYLSQMLVQLQLILAPTRTNNITKPVIAMTLEQVQALEELATLMAKSVRETSHTPHDRQDPRTRSMARKLNRYARQMA
jgi:hypothetical protein